MVILYCRWIVTVSKAVWQQTSRSWRRNQQEACRKRAELKKRQSEKVRCFKWSKEDTEAAVGAVIGGSESETGSSEILHAAEQPCKNNYGKNIHLCKARENPFGLWSWAGEQISRLCIQPSWTWCTSSTSYSVFCWILNIHDLFFFWIWWYEICEIKGTQKFRVLLYFCYLLGAVRFCRTYWIFDLFHCIAIN